MDTPTEQEINRCLDWCFEAEDEGTHFHGMTYEQGVRDAIEFMRDEGSNPADA
jgi:hypothetical protein